MMSLSPYGPETWKKQLEQQDRLQQQNEIKHVVDLLFLFLRIHTPLTQLI